MPKYLKMVSLAVGVGALGIAGLIGASTSLAETSSQSSAASPTAMPPMISPASVAASLPSFQQTAASLTGDVSLTVNGNPIPLENIVTDVDSLRQNQVQQLANSALSAGPSVTSVTSTPTNNSTAGAIASAVSQVLAPAQVQVTAEEAVAEQVVSQLLYSYAQQNDLVVSYATASQICAQNLATWQANGSPAIAPLDGNGETPEQMLDSSAAIAFTQQLLSEQAAQTAVAGPAVVNGVASATSLANLRTWFATAVQNNAVSAVVDGSFVPASSLPALLQFGV